MRPPATPQFAVGDRVFSHYVMQWGTIETVEKTTEPTTHGVTGEPLPGSTWYHVRTDNGRVEYLDDADGVWDLARIIPPHLARRYGYGPDPHAGRAALLRALDAFRGATEDLSTAAERAGRDAEGILGDSYALPWPFDEIAEAVGGWEIPPLTTPAAEADAA